MTKEKIEESKINLVKFSGFALQINPKNSENISDKRIEALFNEAVYLINSKHIKKGIYNFYFLAEKDELYLKRYRLQFLAEKVDDFQKAYEIFSLIIKAKPNFKFAYYYRAISGLMREKKDWDSELNQIINDCATVIQLDSNFIDAYSLRGKAYSLLMKFEDAIYDCTRAISIAPDDAIAYRTRGEIKSKMTNYDGAIADFSKAIDILPDDIMSYYHRAIAKHSLDDHRGAILDLDLLVRLDPFNSNANYILGDLQTLVGDYSGAICTYTKLIYIHPSEAYFYRERSYAKKGLHDYAGAIADLTYAINLDPNDEGVAVYDSTYHYRGQIKWLLGDYYEAKLDFIKAEELSPEDNQIPSRSDIELYIEKEEYYNSKVEAEPNNADAYSSRAEFNHNHYYYSDAIEDLTKAILIDPNNARYYLDRGWNKKLTYDLKGALADLNEAIKIDKRNAKALKIRGDIKWEMDERSEAVIDYERSAQLTKGVLP